MKIGDRLDTIFRQHSTYAANIERETSFWIKLCLVRVLFLE